MVFLSMSNISMVFGLFYFISIVSAQTDLNIADGKNIRDISSPIQEGYAPNRSIDVPNLIDQAGIRIAFDHIFISKKNDSILISETVVFRNEGPEIHYSQDNHTFFAISTPPGIRDLKTQAMECCLVEEEGIVYMDPMKPIKKGENFEMEISYALPANGKEYLFNKSTIYNTSSLSIFINKKSGLDVKEPSETLLLSGIEYNAVTFNEIRAGETASLRINIKRGSGIRYAGFVLILIFLFGLVYCFREKLGFRKKKVQTLEDLELEKKKIFQAIHGFTKHAGSEESEEYRKLMEEYRNKAIQICYDIDKFKNKKEKIMENEDKNDKYVPALKFSFLTKLYDPLIKLAMPENKIKQGLVRQANIGNGNRILDVGCGTGSLIIQIKMSYPDAQVIGLDGDPKILEIARSKISSSGLDISLDTGMAFELPYPDKYFDHVFSSLTLHHLSRKNKKQSLSEMLRVLKPGGELHVADFGKPQNFIMRLISIIMVRLEDTQDNVKGLLPGMFQEAGFIQINEAARYMTIFGTISLYRAMKPE